MALAVGCGGGGQGEEDKVRSVLEDFSSANLEGRWSEACDLMTTRARESLASIGANRGEMGGCAATLKTGVGKLDEAELKKYFEDVEVTAIKVNGPTATAKVDGEPNSLAKRGGRWLVDLNREG